MQSLRGERFFVPLADHVQAAEAIERKATGALPGTLVGDVLERPASSATLPPAPPKVKATPTGFPEHRKRTRQSVFKQRRDGAGPDVAAEPDDERGGSQYTPKARDSAVDPTVTSKDHGTQSFEQADRLRIDQENRDRLRNMSPAAIERERAELFSGLSPALIQRLLQRSTIDDQQGHEIPESADGAKSHVDKKVSFAPGPEKVEEPGAAQADDIHVNGDVTPGMLDEAGPKEPVEPAAIAPSQLPSIHFPQPPEPPDLDPRSESFLADLHEKYFPNLSHDPAKLSWMQPSSSSDTSSAYHPSQLSLAPTELRFDFKGSLLPPNLSRQIPVTHGLHHHGDAPDAAGYTIPELAHLARSSNASQRCIAFQTAGRILYRLGVGDFGREDDEMDEIAALSRGLWDTVEESGIIQIMAVEAGKEKGHLSARAYAQEALWNWRRGGGRKRRAQ